MYFRVKSCVLKNWYMFVLDRSGRGNHCQSAADQESIKPGFINLRLKRSFGRANASFGRTSLLNPVAGAQQSGPRRSTICFTSIFPGCGAIIHGLPMTVSQKSSRVLIACYAACANWATLPRSHSMMRAIPAAHQNRPGQQGAGRLTGGLRKRKWPSKRGSFHRQLTCLRLGRGLGHLVPAVIVAWVAWGTLDPAWATPLSAAEFAATASRCAPSVSAQTLAAVARTESGFDPWALHDNTTGLSESPGNAPAALADASAWVARGDSVDIGMMQINSANLPALNMTVVSALDPCVSLAGGAAVLQAAFGDGNTSSNAQVALLLALSRYNTGSPLRGIMNGYARKVMANGSISALPAATTAANAFPSADTNAPPSWDVSATGAYAQSHGAPWLVPLDPDTDTPKQPVGLPAPAQAPETLVASNQASSSPQATTRSP